MLNNKKKIEKKKRPKNVSFILIPFFNKRVVLQSLPQILFFRVFIEFEYSF